MTRALVAVLAPLFVACSGSSPAIDAGFDAGSRVCLDPDAGPAPDAGDVDGGDFSCAGVAAPTSAVADLVLAGTVTSAGLTRNPVVGATVELFDPGGTRIDTGTSDADGGAYRVEHAIDCTAYDGYLRASHADAGFYDFYYYPPAPWRRGRTELELVIFDASTRNLATLLAMVTVTPGTGAIALGLEDCTRTPITGATVTTMPAGDVRYVGPGGLPLGPAAQTSTSPKGQALIFNLPVGNVTVTASVQGRTLTRTVAVRADSISAVTLVP
ncbi:MAG: hypothetical protein JNK82_31155 [Myxococcaceae bacterium]|nr:hypothetical protein [Myxococcaceae bacterium]